MHTWGVRAAAQKKVWGFCLVSGWIPVAGVLWLPKSQPCPGAATGPEGTARSRGRAASERKQTKKEKEKKKSKKMGRFARKDACHFLPRAARRHSHVGPSRKPGHGAHSPLGPPKSQLSCPHWGGHRSQVVPKGAGGDSGDTLALGTRCWQLCLQTKGDATVPWGITVDFPAPSRCPQGC